MTTPGLAVDSVSGRLERRLLSALPLPIKATLLCKAGPVSAVFLRVFYVNESGTTAPRHGFRSGLRYPM